MRKDLLKLRAMFDQHKAENNPLIERYCGLIEQVFDSIDNLDVLVALMEEEKDTNRIAKDIEHAKQEIEEQRAMLAKIEAMITGDKERNSD
jgi:predicted transcriptional regulator